jgi:hypothetical protein
MAGNWAEQWAVCLAELWAVVNGRGKEGRVSTLERYSHTAVQETGHVCKRIDVPGASVATKVVDLARPRAVALAVGDETKGDYQSTKGCEEEGW